MGQVEGLSQGIAGGEDVAGVVRRGKPLAEELNLPGRDGADDRKKPPGPAPQVFTFRLLRQQDADVAVAS
jgi:hypothetical protein